MSRASKRFPPAGGPPKFVPQGLHEIHTYRVTEYCKACDGDGCMLYDAARDGELGREAQRACGRFCPHYESDVKGDLARDGYSGFRCYDCKLPILLAVAK